MISDKDYALNCNTVLDLLEKNELLPSAWVGKIFDQLPQYMRDNVVMFMSQMREEIKKELQSDDLKSLQ